MKVARAAAGGRVRHGWVDGGVFRVVAGDIFFEPHPTGETFPLDDVHLLSPVAPRTVLLVIGGFARPNSKVAYMADHPRLTPKVVADEPSGQGGHIVHPGFAEVVVAEAELAVVIGRTIRGASSDEVWDAIGGFTVMNDVTAPQFIGEFHDYHRSKGIDGFCSLGPWIATDITDADVRDGLQITTTVNGGDALTGSTREFRHSVADVVSYASRFVTLHPGDVISLGTPLPETGGLRPLAVGDVVEMEVEGVGTLVNRVVADPTGQGG